MPGDTRHLRSLYLSQMVGAIACGQLTDAELLELLRGIYRCLSPAQRREMFREWERLIAESEGRR